MLNNVVIFDFETSGLNPQKDRVIEMAAIRVCEGKVVSEFSTLVNSGSVSEKITELTGITNEQLQFGLSEVAAFKYLTHFIMQLHGTILVAHNAAFDLAFLHFGIQRVLKSGGELDMPFIDTLTISRDRHYYPHKLTDMCQRYEIPLDGAHRALNDVQACWELLRKMHEEEPVNEWVNKLGYLSKYDPPVWAPANAEVFPTANKYEPRAN